MKLEKLLNWKVILAALVILLIIFFSSIINFLVNVQWFVEVGYSSVFFTKLFTELKFGIPIFVVLFLIIYFYLLFMKGQYIKYSKAIYSKQQLKSASVKLFLVAFILSALIAFGITSSKWDDILKFIYATPFNLKDPLFGKDISFYMFRLPMYRTIYNFAFSTLFIITILNLIFYLVVAINTMSENRYSDYNVLQMDRHRRFMIGKGVFEFAAKQMSFFICAIFIMVGIGYLFKNYNLVYSSRGVAFGASYTDVHVTYLFNRILMALSIVAALSIFYAMYKKKVKLTLWVIGIMIGASLVQGIFETAVQKLVVFPNEIVKEKPYIDFNIKYTRLAYGLDNVEQKDFPAEQNLTPQDIASNKNTIDNIRINDFAPALDVYNQLQGIRPYYRFSDVDIDRYTINGKYTQVFAAARELDKDKLPAGSQTWQNKHLLYTHGYGITMSPVNSVTSEGQPNFIIKDIPPVSSSDIKVDRPEIYFGELANDYIITNTKQKEIDYPSGDSNNYTTYQGSAGIKLNGLNRLLFMIKEGSFNFLLSNAITSNSKIILNRNIVQRVQQIAPFLIYDKDPYIVVNGGKLYWIIDAYTASSAYPYSEPINNINYIRNSVKVIIDAYNGKTNFYIYDKKDPIAMTYNKIFPHLFKSADELPSGLKEHLRYPEDIFDIQLEIYKKYHMTDSSIFYTREDMWSVSGPTADTDQAQAQNNSEPSYIIMKLPDGKDEEFMLINPYTPAGKGNMVAWLSARMDKENYGKLIVYKFPRQKTVYGPSQFKAMVNSDPTISKEKSLWNQQGSGIMEGTTITIPIDKSLLYVMPLYIKSTGSNSIPEMKRVILGYGDRIVMEDTLGKALNSMFNIQNTGTTTTQQEENTHPGTTTINENAGNLIKEANDEFAKAKDAQQKGDWAGYGSHINKLESLLKQLNELSK
ncbi:MAG: UPF0182 family protein [Clostridiales bacterium]|nr:UPF0182 family protein [Clostridiales bacterium]